jgi:hypothetical protein
VPFFLFFESMFKDKFKAAGIHFLFCIAIAAVVLGLVYFGWYEGVLSHTQRIGKILLIVLCVDIVLGPLLTFIVFKTGKKSLKFDLSVIAAVQLAFLAYGLAAVYQGRPAFLVFSVDRFEAVAVVDWPEAEKLRASPAAQPNWFKPTFVSAPLPTDPKERSALVLATSGGAADIAQLPFYYKPLEDDKKQLLERLQPFENLKLLNPDKTAELDALLKALQRDAKAIGYLPLKGAHSDATVVLDRATGAVLGAYLYKPWQ